jgi:prophage antirepressor-like protein
MIKSLKIMTNSMSEYRFQTVKCENIEVNVFVTKYNYALKLENICELLEYKNIKEATKLLNERECKTLKTLVSNNLPDLKSIKIPKGILNTDLYIDHTGLNKLILSSKAEKAIEFKHWLCDEFLQTLDTVSMFNTQYHFRFMSPYQLLGKRMINDNFIIPENNIYVLNIEKTLFYVGYASSDLYVGINNICEFDFDHVVYSIEFPNDSRGYFHLNKIKKYFATWSEKQYVDYNAYLTNNQTIIYGDLSNINDSDSNNYSILSLFETEEYYDVGKIIEAINIFSNSASESFQKYNNKTSLKFQSAFNLKN